ncbi:hypothetical protein BGZ99_008465 [Dissophora globulifera]|uniref:Uncharacterized protein n=1 Tax=Dissophora globulifera TaxID=979702 RepID=A0A9P6RB91_9FUNG|nr:hypothetical protein BGZ99_008465 [Dissophora globulifera]
MPVEEASTVNADIGVGLCSTPTAQSSKMSLPSTLQSTSLIPSLTLNPQDLSQEGEVQSTTPAPAMGIVPEFRAALKGSSTSSSITERWLMFDVIASRVLQPHLDFDKVYKTSREESMLELIAECLHDMLHSYGNYFEFHDRIPAGLNEREELADITWTIIRGALRLAKIESRYLEVPVVGVGERKSASKNLLLDSKELAYLADGVGFCGTSQVYLAEASVLSNSESRKHLQDEFRVKRGIRGSCISQTTSLCRQAHPSSGLSVFDSSFIEEVTRVYNMDFAGAFRSDQAN